MAYPFVFVGPDPKDFSSGVKTCPGSWGELGYLPAGEPATIELKWWKKQVEHHGTDS